jgi:hypothetical protein
MDRVEHPVAIAGRVDRVEVFNRIKDDGLL